MCWIFSTKPAPQHVVVTGGSEGIGKSVAKAYLARGAQCVSIISRSPHKLQAAEKELRVSAKEGQSVRAFQCDVGKPDDVCETFKRLQQEVGTNVDCLVCSAGFAICDEFVNLSVDDIQKMVNVNMLGAICCVKQVVPGMIAARSGSICLILSQAGQIALYGFTGYGCTKFGLKGFAEALSMELKHKGICVSTAFPADVDTPGYAIENERKPAITHMICSTASLWSPDAVGRIVVEGIESGTTRITFGFVGFLLDIASSGLSPCVSFLRSIAEILLATPLRVIFAAAFAFVGRTIAQQERTLDESKTKKTN